MKLFNLIQIRGGKESVYMTDSLPKCRARMKQLRNSLRNQNLTFVIRPAEEGETKYRKPPCERFFSGGDYDNYRKRKAKAKKIKKNNQ